MREFKFRAWDSSLNTMHYLLPMFVAGNPAYTELPWNRLIPMQFTGLHDKNGREIYEGDVVRWTSPEPDRVDNSWPTEVAEIVFSDAAYCRKTIAALLSPLNEWESDTEAGVLICETVIGNIHQNPELLTG